MHVHHLYSSSSSSNSTKTLYSHLTCLSPIVYTRINGKSCYSKVAVSSKRSSAIKNCSTTTFSNKTTLTHGRSTITFAALAFLPCMVMMMTRKERWWWWCSPSLCLFQCKVSKYVMCRRLCSHFIIISSFSFRHTNIALRRYTNLFLYSHLVNDLIYADHMYPSIHNAGLLVTFPSFHFHLPHRAHWPLLPHGQHLL